MSSSPQNSQAPSVLYDYAGAIHIHSTLSDGTGTVDEIIRHAQDAALDFAILTDHEHLDARELGYQGWHGDLLFLVGEEVSPRFRDHYLAFDIRQSVRGRGGRTAQEVIDAVAAQGGIGFIAHPIGEGYPSRAMACPWTDWDATGYTGIEIWSYMHDWVRGTHWGNVALALSRPDSMLSGPHHRALAQWDRVGATRRVVGIGTLDVHAKRMPGIVYPKVLPYPFTFRSIRTHILLDEPLVPGDADLAANRVYAALRHGNCFISHDGIADSTGFQFTAQRAGRIVAMMGDELPLEPGISVYASVPEPAHISLIRFGNVVAEADDKRLSYAVTGAGVYRVEVRRRFRPWIYSNPIYVRAPRTHDGDSTG
ncbi:hypothetical protein FJZ36_14470 [Candidatus Poribacteria bacterium]|nr:hypothetical protein [Candidatus Poribacteria bacterium]